MLQAEIINETAESRFIILIQELFSFPLKNIIIINVMLNRLCLYFHQIVERKKLFGNENDKLFFFVFLNKMDTFCALFWRWWSHSAVL